MLAYRRLFRADAAFPNVSCKLSGMITEADWRPLIEALGPLAESERELIFGGTAARFYGLTA